MPKPLAKQGRGVGLRPALWAKIEAVAEEQDKSVSEVIEEVVSLHLPSVGNFVKTGSDSVKSESTASDEEEEMPALS